MISKMMSATLREASLIMEITGLIWLIEQTTRRTKTVKNEDRNDPKITPSKPEPLCPCRVHHPVPNIITKTDRCLEPFLTAKGLRNRFHSSVNADA
jgi:hypothetical protein